MTLAAIVEALQQPPPPSGWTTRALEGHTGISSKTIAVYISRHRLRPYTKLRPYLDDAQLWQLVTAFHAKGYSTHKMIGAIRAKGYRVDDSRTYAAMGKLRLQREHR